MTAVMQKTPRRKISADEMKKARERDNRVVKGRFRCLEVPGGQIQFCFKKYKGDQVRNFTMVDGEIYDIPLMVAKHLNENCWYPKHKHVLDAAGNPMQDVGKKVQRCTFESLEFSDMGAEDDQ